MSALARLAAKLVTLEGQVRALSTTPQLASSSIEGGGAVDVNDQDGNLVAQFGGQFDGSYMAASLSGPTPLTPTTPIVDAVEGGLRVRWAGTFLDGDFAHMDFSRVEVHIGTTPDFDSQSADTLRGSIESPRAGEVMVALPPVQHWACLVTRSLSGGASAPSDQASAIPLAGLMQAQASAAQALLAAEAAQQAAESASTSANGKSRIKFSVTAPNSTVGYTDGDIWFQRVATTGVVTGQWEFVSGEWQPRTVANEVIANLDVGKLTTGELNASTRLIAGDVTAAHAELTGTGFYAFTEGFDGGDPTLAVSIGTGSGDTIALYDGAGNITSSLDPTGGAAFQAVTITGRDMDGDGAVDGGFQVYGTEFTDWLAGLARGLVVRGSRDTNPGAYSNIEQRYQQLDFTAKAGRVYRITATGHAMCDTTSGRTQVKLRYYSGSGAASIANSTSLFTWRSASFPGVGTTLPFNIVKTLYLGSSDSDISLLVTYQGEGSAGCKIDTSYGPQEIIVEDIGLYVPDTGIDLSQGGTPPATKKNYVTAWTANASQTYYPGGSTQSTTDMVQGNDGSYGDRYAKAVFAAGATSANYSTELGKSIATALSGAAVTKVEVYLYASRWWFNSGGTAVIRPWNSTSLSSSTNAVASKQVSGWGRGVGKWVDITSVASASIRGVQVGQTGSTSQLYYGRFNGAGATGGKPQLRISYTK